jgi:carboxy-cis,cis-muconate cyclase
MQTSLARRGLQSILRPSKMPAVHHLMVGTWTPPGAIFTFAFNEETLELKLVKRTEIPQDEPISWMSFDVSSRHKYI